MTQPHHLILYLQSITVTLLYPYTPNDTHAAADTPPQPPFFMFPPHTFKTVTDTFQSIHCMIQPSCFVSLTLKGPGFLDPSHSRGVPTPKISETDWQNIKCVVLVDSYDPPESIGIKKCTNIPCMTPQWHHKWRHVKNMKITKNRQNHGFSLFFQAKVAFFGNDVCQSMLTHVLTPNKPNK